MKPVVKVPGAFEAVFQKMQERMNAYFKDVRTDAETCAITISGERYITVRAAALSVEFFRIIRSLFEKEGKNSQDAVDTARGVLFDIAHAIGKSDASTIIAHMGLTDPAEKFAVGPLHFTHSGCSSIAILSESKVTFDENMYIVFENKFNFEADSWSNRGKRANHPSA